MNVAQIIRRKLWRLQSALKVIEPTDKTIQIVGSVLWRLSVSDRSQGEKVWMDWLTEKKFDKEKTRAYWDTGFDEAPFYPVEIIYRAAQLTGWRYPIAQNLNKLEEMSSEPKRHWFALVQRFTRTATD
jgi:hypothetical protein